MNATLLGKPDAGNPHVRFDEGDVAPVKPRRGTLLYKSLFVSFLASLVLTPAAFGANAWMQQARRTPAWFTEGVMYQIQPRAFTPEGTLKAAEKVTAFVRRGKGETILVVQNWTADNVACDISFDVPKSSVPSYIVAEDVDRNVKGTVADKPFLARRAARSGERSYALGSYGFVIAEVK